MSNGPDLPDDVDLLKALLVEARGLLAERDIEIEQLKAQIDKLRRMQFGRKSEQLQRQIETFETQLEALAAGRGVADVQRALVRGANSVAPMGTTDAEVRRQALPAHLARENHLLEPEPNCPDCGQTMQPLGEDTSEQLARVAAAFKVIRTIRRKLVCPGCHAIKQPPMPGLPIERSIAHPSLLADILVSKYADHQPLYRQSAIAARDGVTLDRASMGRWVGQCEAMCAPLIEALRRYTVSAAKLHADDTPIPVLAPGNRKTRTGRLWVYVRDDRRSGSTQPAAVWYAYSPNRQGIHPQTHLAGFKGTLQADAYAGFDELFLDGSIMEAACHAHARRKFYDIHVRTPSDTTQKALEYIGALYDIEAYIRGKPADERLRIRQQKAKPLLQIYEAWLKAKLEALSSKSDTAKAINYSLNQWRALTLYCEDGMLEIDNNIAENALRCVSLGRKNFLFAGSDSGGVRAAAMYSLIGTCLVNDIDPRAYFNHVLKRIADYKSNRINELLPWCLGDTLVQSSSPSGAFA